MRSSILLAITATASAILVSSASAATLTALSSFGGGDGWRAPNEIVTGDSAGTATGSNYNYLSTGSLERGLAYNPTTGNLILVSRSAAGNGIRILSGTTGADLGALNQGTGIISGGTFATNAVAVASDGAIYVGNLTTGLGAPSPFKVYKWANEAGTPTNVVTDSTSITSGRLGDNLTVNGSGSATRLAAGYGNVAAATGDNSYAIVDPTAGTSSAVVFPGANPGKGDFRLGITFVDSSHVIGTQGSSIYRYTSFSGTSGTLIASPTIPDPVGATADRLVAYAVVGGVPLLAVQSVGDSHVSIYNVSDPTAPTFLVSGNLTTGALTSNANASGNLAWGAVTGATATLYTMSTNQGIQAFTFSLPEPASMAALGGLTSVLLRRRR